MAEKTAIITERVICKNCGGKFTPLSRDSQPYCYTAACVVARDKETAKQNIRWNG